jgi:hypothetical protein
MSGDPHDKANASYRVWHSVVVPGESPPAKSEELSKSFFTRRKKDFIEFDYGDEGKTASRYGSRVAAASRASSGR